MSVVIKAKNDVIYFKCVIDKDFLSVIYDINRLLDNPLFIQQGYYPKAFFDFDCHILSEKELDCLIDLLFVKKRVLFCGVNIPKINEKMISINKEQIHAGEIIKIKDDTLFLGSINNGGVIYCEADVYFLSKVKGKIIALNRNVHIYGHHFEHAQIRIMNHFIHDLTIFSNVMIYDNKENIVVNKEEDIWQESF